LSKLVASKRDFELALPKGYLSVSQINKYLGCGRRYEYEYVLSRPYRSGSGLVLGRTVHKIAEHTLRKYIADQFTVPSADFVGDTISTLMKEYLRQVDVWENTYEDAPNPQKMFEEETRILSELFRLARVPELHPRTVEYKIESKLADWIPFVGFADIIDRDLELEKDANLVSSSPEPQWTDTARDIKVTGKKYGENRLRGSLQLSLYAGEIGTQFVGYDLIVRKGTGKKSVPRMIPQPAEEPGYKLMRTEEEIVWAQEIALDVAEGISAGYFPRCDPEAWVCCEKWCDHYSECRGKKS